MIVSVKPAANTLTTLLSCPAGYRYSVNIFICNSSTTSSDYFTINLVPSGGTADATNYIVGNKNIGPGGTIEISGIILDQNESIIVQTTGGYANFVANYIAL